MKRPVLSDPLLNAARILIYFAMGVIIFAMVMLGIGIGAIATVARADLLAELATAGAPGSSIWALGLALVLIMVLLGLAYRFVEKLLEIVNSVALGDPFDPANADRLSTMGWVAVAGQVIVLPIAAISAWFAPYLEKAGKDADLGFGIDFGSLLLIVILFILARVFRKGAEMRAELEGTV